jgi:hypothetical protein
LPVAGLKAGCPHPAEVPITLMKQEGEGFWTAS